MTREGVDKVHRWQPLGLSSENVENGVDFTPYKSLILTKCGHFGNFFWGTMTAGREQQMISDQM